jgi:methyl-accepting chemotaxis protein
VIEFDVDGIIQNANKNFLDVVGYSLDEVVGSHHRVFVGAEERDSPAYREFWSRLNRGEHQAGEFKRVVKGGRVIWLQATYTPIVNAAGKVMKVIKFAADVTARKLQSLQDAGRIAAIGRAQAVIEFDMDGLILTANDNFLKAMGYTLADVQGKHHSMFVEPALRDGAEYRAFWTRLRAGQFDSAEYKRIGKGGREVWIQASYNPVLDDSGRPTMVVKFATDVTARKLKNADYEGQLAAISKSQAVIEFAMDGTILTANENFLKTLGYRLPEIQGKHHRMFVHAAEREQPAYHEFWKTLQRGEYVSAEFNRMTKSGGDVWIQASYNPILDLNGRPCKVVKYASDITAQVLARQKSDQVRDMMQRAATGADELRDSVQEISVAMDKSQETVATASEEVSRADQQANRLNVAAEAMGGIVTLIGNITSQINLLALNATIESARAGEAGRGFAVVASEVKNLANQAKDATDRISNEIGGLSGISEDVTASLQRINSSMGLVKDYVTSTATAVREQTAVSETMSNSMKAAAAEAESIRL